jgi:Domain of unknown function (DUF4124)
LFGTVTPPNYQESIPVLSRHAKLWTGLVLSTWLGSVASQTIYKCIDAQGRKLTSDRPIPECVDRDQQELSRSGVVKRTLSPVATQAEQAAQAQARELAAQKAAEELAARNEAVRRDKVLLSRYPDKAAHDRVRADSLAQYVMLIRTATQHVDELREQRKKIDAELEFYKGNPAKVPATLKRQIEESETGLAAQRRYIADQESEKNRVSARFDAELAKLTPLWQASVSAAR